MYERGDLILYGNSGVYRVEEIGPIRHISGYDAEKAYYKLSSARRGEITYVPVDTSVYIRPVVSCEEAAALLEEAAELETAVCDSRDPRELREHYQAVMAIHSCRELMRLIKSVNKKAAQAARRGKKLGKTDQDYKKRAETLLCEEFSVVLELPVEEIRAAVARALKETK